jgi:precorrin-6A synthase
MLDGDLAFRTLTDEDLDIYWGAYLGTPDELLVSGPLAETAGEIEHVRAEAKQRKGWMFDTYLLRRR